ncbi:MAG TPA: 50S ribosomal protein L6 [Longimicrobiales bacterium]|nr:50S ribosomal protein L6 [Longimicrobiales bacterium]
MSRIGRKPVVVPSGVNVTVDGTTVKVKGPKGELSHTFPGNMKIRMENNEVLVERPTDNKDDRALHGLTRALIGNMVQGVTEGFKKTLEIVGVGYKAEKKGKNLIVTVGYSHPVEYPEPEGITLTAPAPTTIVVEGIDKQKVGQVAAELRQFRKPEPYKGKGIRYQGEQVRRKAGKTAGK